MIGGDPTAAGVIGGGGGAGGGATRWGGGGGGGALVKFGTAYLPDRPSSRGGGGGGGGARRRSATSLRERSLSSDGHPSRHKTPETIRDSVDDRGGGRVVAEQPKLGGGGKSLLPRV
jgi:hypothetical protein